MRRLLALTVLLMLVLPANAASPALVRTVQPGEPGIGASLTSTNAVISYLDANGNSHVDASNPDEPVYLDMDGSRTVSYGDVRLTPFMNYAAGSVVDITNRDLALALGTPSGWFATAGSLWYIDFDFSASLSLGDLRLSEHSGEKVASSDSDFGTPLAVTQASVPSGNRVNYVDSNGDHARQINEPIVLDIDDNSPSGSRHFSVGDLVIVPGTFATEPVVAPAAAQSTQSSGPGAGTTNHDAPTAALHGDWRSTDWALLSLALLNLVGLIVLARNFSQASKPRNPFK